jgi:small subunit ribosomal protein S23
MLLMRDFGCAKLICSSVVQRQMWLIKHKGLSKASAYDLARREFYQHRHRSEIRSRIAKEEAQHVGAYFGKSALEVGMELEDRSWEAWKQWANVQIEDEQASRAQMFSGPQDGGTDEGADMSAGEFDLAVEELASQGSVPNTPQSKIVPSGASAPAHA